MRPYGNLVNFGLLRTIEMDLKIQNMFSFAALTHEIIDNVLAIISRLFSRKWAIFNQGLVETLNQIPLFQKHFRSLYSITEVQSKDPSYINPK